MEKVGLSFLVGGIVGSSFTSSISNVKNSISGIDNKIKMLSKEKLDLKKQLNLDGAKENTKEINEQINKLTKNINNLNSIKSIKTNMSESINTLSSLKSTLFSVSLGLVGFSSSYNDVVKSQGEIASLGISAEGISKITKVAKEFSNQWAGVSAPEFISASYDIKSGISSLTDEGVAEFTRLAALTGTATKATVKEMTNLFSSAYGAFKTQFSSDKEFANYFSNAISASVQAFKTDGPDLINAIQSLGGFAVGKGVSLAEQLSIIGVSKETFGSASEAATSYKAFLNGVGKAQDMLGLKFTDSNGKMLPMVDILDSIKNKYGDFIDVAESDQLKKAFGSDEAIRIISDLINKTDSLRKAEINLNNEMKAGVRTMEMAKAMQMGRELELLKQQFINLASTIGGIIAPAISFISTNLGKFSLGLNKFIEDNSKLVTILAQVIGAMVTLFVANKVAKAGMFFLKGVFESIIFLGKALSPVLLGTTKLLKYVAVGFRVLTVAMISNPIGAAIAGIVTAIGLLYYNWDTVSDFMIKTWDKIKEGFISAKEFIVSFGSSVIDFYSSILSKIIDIVLAPFNMIKEQIINLKSYFGLSESDNLKDKFTIVKDVTNENRTIEKVVGANNSVINNRSLNAPMTFSPNITINGNANKDDVIKAVDYSRQSFEKQMQEYQHNQARLSFSTGDL